MGDFEEDGLESRCEPQVMLESLPIGLIELLGVRSRFRLIEFKEFISGKLKIFQKLKYP